MKKLFMLFISLILAVATVLQAFASQEIVNVYENRKLVKSVVFKIGVPYYVVNGQTPGVKMDTSPFIQDGRTFVPVRFLGNALGLDDSRITWDGPTRTATLRGNATLQMTVGRAQVVSDGQARDIDVAPVIVDPGRTMLPARYVAEGLGYEVGWDEATQTVVCWPAGEPKPDVTAAVDYLNNQGTTPPVVPGNKVNGYIIPANTDLEIFDEPYQVGNDGKYIVFQIQLKKGNLQQQYADAQSILLQTVDADTVNAVLSYAKQASVRDKDNRLPPIKTFNSPNGMAVRVTGGDITVQFDLWSTK
ncbi:MAG: copper amine oxidase N-terminal domain-containing protein [Peptococcaceae bacterium]|nr:copper amine oxidase N-terminal domain-containing protein [Peptococcaceae bacterium]